MSVNIRVLNASQADFNAQLKTLAQYPNSQDEVIDQRVAAILADVKARGDAAVLGYTAKFDELNAANVSELEIKPADMQAALKQITPAQRTALEHAIARVKAYHEHQFRQTCQSFEYTEADGTVLGQKVTPIDRVGLYVPGGKAAYPSSLIMNAVPAKVAGVGELIVMVPTPKGERNALVLAAMALTRVDRAFTIGGAQAVAALAYGTATIPKVDKITGPGNAYVAAAKRRVFGAVGIDMIAGPSEILVIADGSTPPEWTAIDLFSQAEHEELSQSLLLTPSVSYLSAVKAAIDKLLPTMPRKDIIRASLEGRGALILTRDMNEACAISNQIAPEHLEVQATHATQYVPLLKHAGAIFLGAYTSESLGDYCAGPNHVLPTVGTARFSSPLGVYDFVKRSSIINVSEAGAQLLGKTAAELAYGERLPAHARAAELRVK